MDGIGSINSSALYSHSSSDVSKVMSEANKFIKKYDLTHLGWRGFDQLDWVSDITNKYPEAVHIAHTCSSMDQDKPYLDQVKDLMDSASSAEDKKGIHNYFMGKLGLEELSCRNSGGAGGLCDKKGAFIEISCLTTKMLKD